MYKHFLKIKTWVILIAALLSLALLFQFICTKMDAYRYSPPGKLVDMGGYKLHLYCTGSGPSTVILDAGAGCSSLEWSLVQPKVSRFARVCSFDRAGFGWSEQSQNPRTSVNMVEELHTLLQKANVHGPYILVGHSFGGNNMRIYASKYPEEVKGVVLVDAAHEDFLDKLHITSPSKLQILWRKFKIYLGYERVENYFADFIKECPVNIQKVYLSQLSHQNLLAELEERSNMPQSFAQLRAHSNGLHDKPLIVISATDFDDEEHPKFKEIWPVLQKDLLTKSKFSKQIMASKSDHMITRKQPDVIVDAIKMSL